MKEQNEAVVDREPGIEQESDELVATPGAETEKRPRAIRSPHAKIVAALKQVEQLQGLDDEEFEWLANHGTEVFAPAGTVIFEEGSPATKMSIILDGEIHVQARNQLFIGRSGQVTGLLPFSRMKAYGGRSIAVVDTWAVQYDRELFPEILKHIPGFAKRAVSILLDRTREVTRMEQQGEKLLALGKLAGNLAHELNNPASAAQRSAATLLQELRTYGTAKFRLGRLCLDDESYQRLREWDANIRQQLRSHRPAEAIALSDREEQITGWLTAHAIDEPWTLAAPLAEAGVDSSHLEPLLGFLPPTAMGTVLIQFTSSLRAERMTESVLDATERIFDLIRAIKDYSYMDQAPLQEVDVAQSLDNTLSMLGSSLGNVNIVREYQKDLSHILAYGSELNQVWTELIQNALEAMNGRGTLRLKTAQSGESILVEIWDSGPGVPAELKDRIFEPFFTTKAPGRGLGLGLDTAMRILRKHRGFLTVESRPGATCFQVRLPIHVVGAY